MTLNEKRNAIADACGWIVKFNPDNGLWRAENQKTGRISEWWSASKEHVRRACFPDYFYDLNAMHEAERHFDSASVDEQSKYLDYLYCTVGWADCNNAQDAKHKCYFGSVRATAAQRAEAFGLTLKLWT